MNSTSVPTTDPEATPVNADPAIDERAPGDDEHIDPPSSASADSAAPAATSDAQGALEPAALSEGSATTEPASPSTTPASPALPGSAPPAQTDAGPQLRKLFPALFGHSPKPLKLQIQNDIQARAPGVFSKKALSAFFRRYTGSHAYLNAVAHSKERFGLDGEAAGELTAEHRKIAADELARRRASHVARVELEEQQRRNRAGLLHDFQTTTLTAANFCALKGVAVDELDGLLDIARREADERARAMRTPDARPHDGRPSGHRSPDPRSHAPRAQDPRSQDPRSSGSRAQDPSAQDPHSKSSRAQDPSSRAQSPRAHDPRAQDARSRDSGPAPARATEPRRESGRPPATPRRR